MHVTHILIALVSTFIVSCIAENALLFSYDFSDSTGLELHGGATLENNQLHLNGSGYAVATDIVGKSLFESKSFTIVVKVRLDSYPAALEYSTVISAAFGTKKATMNTRLNSDDMFYSYYNADKSAESGSSGYTKATHYDSTGLGGDDFHCFVAMGSVDDTKKPIVFIDGSNGATVGSTNTDYLVNETVTDFRFGATVDTASEFMNGSIAAFWVYNYRFDNTLDIPTACNPPTPSPTGAPTSSHAPTTSPSLAPSESPSVSPTNAPTTQPTEFPTTSPTTSPTELPTMFPTVSPTMAPSISPTMGTCIVSVSTTGSAGLSWSLKDSSEDLLDDGEFGDATQSVTLDDDEDYALYVSSTIIESGSLTVTITGGNTTTLEWVDGTLTSEKIANVNCETMNSLVELESLATDSAYTAGVCLLALLVIILV